MQRVLFLSLCLTAVGLANACSAPPSAPKVERNSITEASPEEKAKRRVEVHELMLKGEYHHDGSVELEYIGDMSSVPALMEVLKANPPSRNGTMVCTASHALVALRKITGANPGIRYEDWNAWWQKNAKKP